jgi:hypothetical protein
MLLFLVYTGVLYLGTAGGAAISPWQEVTANDGLFVTFPYRSPADCFDFLQMFGAPYVVESPAPLSLALPEAQLVVLSTRLN